MPNYYQRGLYPAAVILDTIFQMRNVRRSDGMRKEEVLLHPLLKDVNDRIDELFRFTDDDYDNGHGTPALAFNQVAVDKEGNTIYTLVYIDTALEDLWRKETDKEITVSIYNPRHTL